jgi:hypothetical protein
MNNKKANGTNSGKKSRQNFLANGTDSSLFDNGHTKSAVSPPIPDNTSTGRPTMLSGQF